MSTATFHGKTVLITGASRGLGRALVDEALERGATRVLAASRTPIEHTDARVKAIALDVTDPTQIRQATDTVDELDVLVNNAGVSVPDDLSARDAFDSHFAVNLWGTLDVTQAFMPQLIARQGTLVNVVSLSAIAAVPVLPAYSVSKAAMFSLTQSLRALYAGRGVSVHAVLGGPIDTDMVRELPISKTAPNVVARGIFDGVARGEADIFPDPYADTFSAGWRAEPPRHVRRLSSLRRRWLPASGGDGSGPVLPRRV